MQTIMPGNYNSSIRPDRLSVSGNGNQVYDTLVEL